MAKANSKAPAAKQQTRSKADAKAIAKKLANTPFVQLDEYIQEITAIHAHMDALALAFAEAGSDAFRDGEVTAAMFDLEERLMHVRDDLVTFNTKLAKGEPSHA